MLKGQSMEALKMCVLVENGIQVLKAIIGPKHLLLHQDSMNFKHLTSIMQV